MTIHLPKELEIFIHAEVKSGRFMSEDEAIAAAVRLLRDGEPADASPIHAINQSFPSIRRDAHTMPDPALGSIGALRDAADELDEIVAEAYRRRREEPWRELDL